MYENMMEELKKLANQVDAWEIESKEACKNLEAEVQKGFADKEKHIAEFVNQMIDAIMTANIPIGREIQLFCCGNHWDGAPNVSGSHCRSIGLCFCHEYDGSMDAWFGRWFSGTGNVDQILVVKPEKLSTSLFLSGHGRLVAETLRENILSRWNEDTEDTIAKQVFAKCKEELAKRTKTATEKLKAANERYAQFCGKEE